MSILFVYLMNFEPDFLFSVQDKKEHKKEQEAFTEKIQQDFHTKVYHLNFFLQ